MRTLFRFEEPEGVSPSDEFGGVDDLVSVGTFAAPVVDGVLGRALDFESEFSAYQGADVIEGATLHTRDVSVQAVLRWMDADQGTPGVIVCRGLDGDADEWYAYGLELRQVTADVGEVRWFWHTSAGVLKTQVGGHFMVEPDGSTGFIMITATRRWVSPTEVELRYYVGAELLAEVSSADGDIGGGTAGHLSIGARRVDGTPPTWEHFLWGQLDELAIYDHALCAEEVAATWARLTVHQPAGVELMRDLAPPGAPISGDPASRIQRLLRVVGEGLGFATAKAEEVREYTLPDRAYGDHLDRWEAIARQTPAALISLEVRRRRVIAHLRSRGIDQAAVREALRELLDVHPTQIEVLSFSNDFTDRFDDLRAERWQADGTWAAVGGTAEVSAGAGEDLRWVDASIRSAARLRMAVPAAGDAFLAARCTYVDFPGDSEGGLVLEHGSRGDRLFYGVRHTSGVYQLVYQRWRAGALVDASPVVLATTTSAAHYLRIRSDLGPVIVGDGEAKHRLQWSLDGVTFTSSPDITWINDHQWAGFYARGTDAGLAGDLTFDFDEFFMRLPFARRPFRWYAYRDPAVPGTPDMAGANALLRRLRHAYTTAAAITSRSVLCDDPGSGCDLGPMGGF